MTGVLKAAISWIALEREQGRKPEVVQLCPPLFSRFEKACEAGLEENIGAMQRLGMDTTQFTHTDSPIIFRGVSFVCHDDGLVAF